MDPQLYIAWTTTETRDDCERLANGLVEKGFAACVQVNGPVHSFYRWRDEVATTEEYRLMIKIAASKLAEAEAWVLARHPYDTPQWVVVAADRVDAGYLAWATGGEV